MTDVDMFKDYTGKIKMLKKKLRISKNISCDLEIIIESQKKEIDTLKQIIAIQELQMETPNKTRTNKIFQLKSILKKCRERGKFDLAVKLTNKYYINEDILKEDDENEMVLDSDETGKDELFQQCLDIISREGKASTSLLQRKLQIGYNRAARIMDQLEESGFISPANHVGKREVFYDKFKN